MSLSCFRSLEPNISEVDQLYNDNSAHGSMYLGNGAPPLCSSTDPPPSGCVVCLHQFVYAICSDLLKTVKLKMEGGGLPIDIIESECPTIGKPAGDDTDAWKWWLLLLLPVVAIIIFLMVAACRKYGGNNLESVTSAVDPCEDPESTV